MTTTQPHRMLVVHNTAGDRVQAFDTKPFRRFAFGTLLAFVDDVTSRTQNLRSLVSNTLALPGRAPVYDRSLLDDCSVAEKYDSVMCHLVLDHGGVVSDDFFARLRAEFLVPGGILLNPVKTIAKDEVARVSEFELVTETAPCVIKKNDNYNKPETVFELATQAELDAWRESHGPEEQRRFVTHKLLRYFGSEESRLYQLERWIVLFDDLTVNYRCSDEFYIKRDSALSYYVRDERRMQSDLERLATSGYTWKGRSIDCAYDRNPAAWDARYAVLRHYREAFGFDYAELDVIQPEQGQFVVIDVNNTPGPAYKNVYWRELAVRLLGDRLGLRRAAAPEPIVARADRPRTNICLCMIVKNETEVLPRLFRSVKDYIDYYVIVDTGSTDGTIELIRSEMGRYGIDGEVHEREWVNFGVNRQQSLELAVAANKADWLLFIDADEELGASDPKFYEKLEPGVSYDIEKHQSGMRYAVPHLVNVRATTFRWEGVVHNYLLTLSGPKQRKLRKDVWIVFHIGEGAKSHGVSPEQKYLRDAKLLEEDLKQNPDNARSQFYLAQSYRDARHRARAYAEYKKRVRMGGWAEEAFIAQLEAAKLALALEEPEDIVVSEYLEAFNMRPTRVEPLHDLARYFRLKGEYGKAYTFARTGVEVERPDDQLFIAQAIYDWRMLDELGVAAFWVGDYASAKEACETVIARAERGMEIPADELQRIRENLDYVLNKLAE